MIESVAFENATTKYAGEAVAAQANEGASAAPPTGPLAIGNYVKHGHGVEINKEEGTRYEGKFKMGKHHGKGKLVYEMTGDSYDGEWVEGEIHGEGRFVFSNGDIFAGEFDNNQMKQGIMNRANGDEYAGDFVNDLFIGYSLYKYANGDIYCGDFLKGKMNGNGVLKIKQSKFDYAGKFENNQLVHGQVMTNEGEFLGEFAPNTRAFHGRGIMKHKSGDVYDG